MYYYPATAAIIGSTLNFLVLAFVILLSWLRFFAPSQYVDETDDYKKVDELDDHNLHRFFVCPMLTKYIFASVFFSIYPNITINTFLNI